MEEILKKTDLGQVMKVLGRHVKNAIRMWKKIHEVLKRGVTLCILSLIPKHINSFALCLC